MDPLYIEMFEKSQLGGKALNQMELQELFRGLKLYKGKCNMDLLSEMRIALGHAGCQSCLMQQSMEGLWLIAYMYRTFEKRWDLNKREWIGN